MTESGFISRVDCAFPYEDEAAAHGLIVEACGISTNACFMVAEELSRPPRSVRAPVETRLRLLAVLRQGFEHPLRDRVLAVAEAQIRGGCVGLADALALLREIAAHRHQHCALNIVYFACDEDVDDVLDAECTRIRDGWAAADT
ncbi:MAG: hypothetical protein WCJ30_12540 [Deltaproteobacteria bacterium]